MAKVFGIVERECPKCGETIPANTRKCPAEQCKHEWQFNQSQYNRLVACAYEPKDISNEFFDEDFQDEYTETNIKGKSISDWNKWREDNPWTGILLEAANLKSANLGNANLGPARVMSQHPEYKTVIGVALNTANLGSVTDSDVNPHQLDDWRIKPEGAKLARADFEGAIIAVPNINDINPTRANFEKANLAGANLKSARLHWCFFWDADLTGADARGAVLYKANLDRADLRDADFRGAFLDGGTYLSKSAWKKGDPETDKTRKVEEPDTKTDFRGAALSFATVEPELLGQLQYNCRRLNWEDWYEDHWCQQLLARPFWFLSDYGRSTSRIVFFFLPISLLFALIYTWGPQLVGAGKNCEALIHSSWFFPRFARAIYFSVVTMTTLGFGDLYANPHLSGLCHYVSHAVLAVHVAIGYVLLGALITRFAIMFQGGVGPVDKPELGSNYTFTEAVEQREWGKAWLRIVG